MTEKQKTPYERVSDSMHGVDDTVRDTLVYPNSSDVLGISEGEDCIVLSYASKHDEGGHAQMVWISTDNIDALHALQASISRLLTRVELTKAKEAVDS